MIKSLLNRKNTSNKNTANKTKKGALSSAFSVMPLRYFALVFTAVAAFVGVGVTVVAAVGLVGAALDVVFAVAFAIH